MKMESQITIASPEEVAARAFQLYEQEGRPEGRATTHWLQAEAELKNGSNNGGKHGRPKSQRKPERMQEESARA